MSNVNTIWIVLDTNIYLHYTWFEEIPWMKIAREYIGKENISIGIGIPEKVLQELNDKKDSARGRIQKRAKKISSYLGQVFLDNKETKYPIKIIPAPNDCDFDDVHYHISNNDDVILLSVHKWEFSNDSIIVSGDNPILIKAKNKEFKFYKIPEQYLLKETLSDEEKEIDELKKKLAIYQNKSSNIKILFKDNKEYIEYDKPEIVDIEVELNDYQTELENKYPIKNKKKYDDTRNSLKFYDSLYDQIYPEKTFEEYNKKRETFIEECLYKKELELRYRDQQQSFKELFFYLDNSYGTAPTGKINIELYFPDDVILYGTPQEIQYDEPIEPKLEFGGVNLPSLAHISLYGRDRGHVSLWTDDTVIKRKTIRLEYDGINHHMTGFLERGIWIDISKCNSFQIEWQAVDANNPYVFSGVLNVVIK